jgi:hypothetical protein
LFIMIIVLSSPNLFLDAFVLTRIFYSTFREN